MWLGEERGHVVDWVTQQWVRLTGRTVDLRQEPWLAGPVGKPTGIGTRVFEEFSREQGLRLVRDVEPRGLLSGFERLGGPEFEVGAVHPAVAGFYERTSEYAIDAWAEWCGAFRPGGALLARLFSRRLQQLNVPLSGLATSRGMTSDVAVVADPSTGAQLYAAWVRQLMESGDVVYAGAYTTCIPPRLQQPCVKVVFPLPNGNAIVIMRPTAMPDGMLSLESNGDGFGAPGFYFTVTAGEHRVVARYVASMREWIEVYASEQDGCVWANHLLTLWRIPFLRIHYRLVPLASAAAPGRSAVGYTAPIPTR